MKILSLRTLGLFAAALIVVDAGSFYQSGATYPGWHQGYIQAGLIELFLAITISVKLKGRLANLIINLLTVLLFAQAVTVSAVTTALPAWEKITSSRNGDQVAAVLANGLSQEKKNTAYMRTNKQSTNLAIAVKAQRKDRAKLVSVLSSATESELRFWVQLITAIVLKITLQFVNLWLFWLAGYYRRQPSTEPLTEPVEALTPVEEVSTVKTQVLTPEPEALTEEKKVLTEETPPSTQKTVVLSPKTIMKKLSLTPSTLADELQISRSIVSSVVNHYNPIMKHLLSMAKA